MNKNLLALFLAALTLSLALTMLTAGLIAIWKPVVRIHIQSNTDVENIVSAITNLHRTDVALTTEKEKFGIISAAVTCLTMAVRFMFISAVIGSFYKFYCTRLGVLPSL